MSLILNTFTKLKVLKLNLGNLIMTFLLLLYVNINVDSSNLKTFLETYE